MPKNISQQKQNLRKEMLLLSQKQDVFHFVAENKKFLEQLCGLPVWHEASSVLLYASLRGEVDLLPLLEKKEARKKRFFFPRIEGEKLRLYEWFPGARWVTGPYNLREPDSKSWEEVSLAEVDLALIPGLAFDSTGGRLGRGGAFYDRLLSESSCRTLKMGVAWSWQLVEKVPRELWDVEMDLVIPF
jgi:5-formyltetrahydrofolate cyclo-ligase